LYNSVFKENKDTNKALVNIVYLADNIASLDRIKKENDDEISENENIKTI
jgi:hypothetical protein